MIKGINWELTDYPIVKKAIFSPPATILLWDDGTKTVVKCQNDEVYDAEKGFTMAYMKKLFGNKGKFNNEIHKWVTDEVERKCNFITECVEEASVTRENVDTKYINWLIARISANTEYTSEAKHKIITALKHYYGV